MTVYQFLVVCQYVSMVLLMFLCAYIIKKWKKGLHSWLFLYTAAVLVNHAGYLAVMHAHTEEAAVLAWQVCYLGRVWIPFALLQFTLVLCKIPRRGRLSEILAGVHAVTYFLVLTMRHNTLYYASWEFVQGGIFPHLERAPGWWHYGYVVVIFSYIVFGLYHLFRLLHGEKLPRRRKQLAFILAAILTECIFYALEVVRAVPGYDLSTFGHTVATLFLYLAIFRYDILGSRELARDFVVDRVSEGVLITDEEDTVIDYNQQAVALLPELVTDPQPVLEQIQALLSENRTLDVEERRYTIKENVLTDDRRRAGKVYMLDDDTDHYRRAERLTREMMLALSKTVDAKDRYTNGHSQRVAQYAGELARRLGKTPEEQELIYEMGLLHDIGKIGVSGEILNKAGRLTDEEFARIREHTVIGYNILRQITVVPELRDGARSHHERYDGKGYPDGLKGEAIPEAARIICVADCYDAMTSTRTYSKPKAQADVRAEIQRCKGTQFDPLIADKMIDMIDEDTEYRLHE